MELTNNDHFIQQRNLLVLKLLLTINTLGLLVEIGFAASYSSFPLIGYLTIAIVWILVKKQIASVLFMYVIVTSYYLFMLYLTSVYPEPTSYIFVWLGLVISSIYNRSRLILLAAFYTMLISLYTFLRSSNEFVFTRNPDDLAYYLLFTLFVAVFLIVQSQHSEKTWNGLKDSQGKLTYILESANIITYSYDPITQVHTVSSGVKSLKNMSKKEVSSSPILWKKYIHGEDESFVNLIEQDINLGKTKSVEYRLQITNNQVMWVSARFFPFMTHDGTVERIEGALVDITERKKVEEKMEFLAYHDALTKLPNRSQLYQFVRTQQGNPKFDYQKAFVIFIDLDSFKQVNDTFGHTAGDQLLSLAATRLTSSLKQKDIVSRIGGDEFVVFIADLTVEQTIQVAERLQKALCAPFVVSGEQIEITPSIGISKFTSADDNLDTLISQADSAMYNIKNKGKNGIRLYNNEGHKEEKHGQGCLFTSE